MVYWYGDNNTNKRGQSCQSLVKQKIGVSGCPNAEKRTENPNPVEIGHGQPSCSLCWSHDQMLVMHIPGHPITCHLVWGLGQPSRCFDILSTDKAWNPLRRSRRFLNFRSTSTRAGHLAYPHSRLHPVVLQEPDKTANRRASVAAVRIDLGTRSVTFRPHTSPLWSRGAAQ